MREALFCRRAALAVTAAALTWKPHAGVADAPASGRARLSIAIGSAEPEELEIGLYDSAPASTALFRNLCVGTVPGEGAISYIGSTASRIEKDRVLILGKLNAGSAQYLDRSIDGTGYVRSELVNRADRWGNSDIASISHDRPGLISMRRGAVAGHRTLRTAREEAIATRCSRACQAVRLLSLRSPLEQIPR